MQIFWRGLGPQAQSQPRLEDWEKKPFAKGVADGPGPGDRRDLYEREVGREEPGAPTSSGIHRALYADIMRYLIFPPELVSGVLRRAPVAVGDTVGILFHTPTGVDLFFAARVVSCFDGQEGDLFRSGFTYQTLEGHPELGEETFAAEKDMLTGAVRLSLRSWSRPGTRLASAFSPIVRLIQVRASHAALDFASSRARR